MKKYIKPQIEFVSINTEPITNTTHGEALLSATFIKLSSEASSDKTWTTKAY